MWWKGSNLKVKQLRSIGLCNSHKFVVGIQRPPDALQGCKGTQNKGEGGWKPAQPCSNTGLPPSRVW